MRYTIYKKLNIHKKGVNDSLEITLKFYLYQIYGVFIIWLGMTLFLDKMYDSGIMIYYLVSSWLLFLIVMAVKNGTPREKNINKTNGNNVNAFKYECLHCFLFGFVKMCFFLNCNKNFTGLPLLCNVYPPKYNCVHVY